jgi:hypothetical protein
MTWLSRIVPPYRAAHGSRVDLTESKCNLMQ